MEIRTMKIEDYEQLYALWKSCAGMGLNSLDDSREGIARFLARNPDTCLAAVESGRIIGAIMTGNDGRRGYIYHTAVHPDYRRRGIAAELVRQALATLEACGIAKAALVVFARNAEGNAFWERMGFTVRTDITYRNRLLKEMTRYDS